MFGLTLGRDLFSEMAFCVSTGRSFRHWAAISSVRWLSVSIGLLAQLAGLTLGRDLLSEMAFCVSTSSGLALGRDLFSEMACCAAGGCLV